MAKSGAASSSLWASSLQSTVANLVTELFHLLATGNVPLIELFLHVFLLNLYHHHHHHHRLDFSEASFGAIRSLVCGGLIVQVYSSTCSE